MSNKSREFDSEEEIPESNSGDGSSTEDAGGGAGSHAKSAGKKATGKLSRKMMRKLARVAIQLMAKLLALLLPYILPILAVLLGIVLIFYVAYDIEYESRGKEKEYQSEAVKHDNKKETTEDGGLKASSLSAGNKIIKSYYAYYTQQSYFKVLDGKMYPATDKKVEEVKDKYNREKEFMLSPDFLWSLDEYLNNDTHRFPEQFIQPVQHDKKTFELKPLTDKDDVLTAKSQKYDKKTLLPVKGETVRGVWDYGFAPLLQYEKFKEERDKRGNLTEMQVWNKDKQKFEIKPVSNGKNMTEGVSGYPKDVYMIEKVTTSIGTISNTITHNWENTGESWTKEYTEKVTVDVRYLTTEKRHKRNMLGLKLYYEVSDDGKRKDEYTILKTDFPVMHDVEVEKWKKETRKAKRKAEGYVWSKEPRYEGEPDTSKIVGSKYMEDYMYHYVSYVPVNAMGEFDLENRTGKKIESLEGILADVEAEQEASSEYDTPAPGTSDSSIDTSIGGVEGGSDKFKKAMQYSTYFQKYGEMYGIDPLLLAAKAAQERGGVHATVADPGGAIGIMQIQVNSHKNTNKKAFNYKTGNTDIVYASPDKLTNLETNIQIGAMIMQNSITDMSYNPLLGLQAYNYGSGGMNKVVTAYASAKGITNEAVEKNVKDNGWMPYRMKVHGKGYGDVEYIEHVLSHYPAGGAQKPYVLDKAGNKVFIDGEIKMGSGVPSAGTPSGDSGFSFWDIMDALKNKWGELFPDAPLELAEERRKFSNKQFGDRPFYIINMAFSMTEGKYFSEYEYITPKMWKEKYKMLFSNPPSATGGASDTDVDQLAKYFPDGYVAVVAKAEKIAVPYNGKGISVQAPAGSKVLALADGKVTDAGRDYVVVDHGTGATTRYSTLKEVKVKKGDAVKKGATVAISTTNVFLEMSFDGSPTDPSWTVNGGSLTGAFIKPTEGRFSSPFGPRISPTGSGINFHYGIDIANAVGTPVKAAAGGEVIKVGNGNIGGYGKYIHIKHVINGKNMSTFYAHLNTQNVRVGDKVTAGQVIAQLGNTGRSTGPHLHFEIQNGLGYHDANPLDPAKYIKL